jgi:hypothetical protein
MARYNIEHTAEDLISHKLQQCGLWIAKPKFDVLPNSSVNPMARSSRRPSAPGGNSA